MIVSSQDLNKVYLCDLPNYFLNGCVACSTNVANFVAVGGGTGLPSQSEALKMMPCQGPGTRARLAEIITGYCLALELSAISALTKGTFVKANGELGRHH